MQSFSVSLQKAVAQLNVEVIYSPRDLSEIPVYSADVNRPGLLLTGYNKFFDATRIQVCGMVEMSYLKEIPENERRSHIHTLFAVKPPAVIVSRSLPIFDEMVEFAKEYEVPLLHSPENTTHLITAMNSTMTVALAPRITRHGVMVEVFGEGILIMGESGVGKSEAAIELVKRGHRLIADDAVELRKVSNRSIVANAPENIRHFVELRGVGIVNIARIFGDGAVKPSEKVDMVVQLEVWDGQKSYSKTGLENDTIDLMGVKLPLSVIPIRPGRNLSIILETAAISNRQKKMGYNAAEELIERLGLQNDIS